MKSTTYGENGCHLNHMCNVLGEVDVELEVFILGPLP